MGSTSPNHTNKNSLSLYGPTITPSQRGFVLVDVHPPAQRDKDQSLLSKTGETYGDLCVLVGT